jgi:nucleoid DNA-binding protein
MKKEQIARRMAKESHITTAAAADQLDRIVSDILKRIRKGETASIPGLGSFRAGWRRDFQFDGTPCARPEQTRSKRAGR